MSEIHQELDAYLAARRQQRANIVEQTLSAMTERERRLVREAAVMGYVLGGMGGGHHGNIPPDGQITSEVIAACIQSSDLYPVISSLRGDS